MSPPLSFHISQENQNQRTAKPVLSGTQICPPLQVVSTSSERDCDFSCYSQAEGGQHSSSCLKSCGMGAAEGPGHPAQHGSACQRAVWCSSGAYFHHFFALALASWEEPLTKCKVYISPVSLRVVSGSLPVSAGMQLSLRLPSSIPHEHVLKQAWISQ